MKKYRALNTNIIVRDIAEEERNKEVKTASGFILSNNITQQLAGDMSKNEGIIEDIGPNAFEDFGERKPTIGSRILYARYAGKELDIDENGFTRRVMQDLDALVIIEDGE